MAHNLKGYILCESNHWTFWKRQNCGSAGCKGLGIETDELGGTQRIFRTVKLLCMILQWWMHVTVHLSKPIERSTLRVNPNVNYNVPVSFH